MLTQNQIRLISSLELKKYRQANGLFVVEGEKMVSELLLQDRIAVAGIRGTAVWAERHPELRQLAGGKYQEVSEQELKKISSLTTPNAVLAVAEIPGESPDFTLPRHHLCFYLDGIQDPGNMGAILRIADWFGFPAVYCFPESVDIYNSKVIQSSMGAVFRVRSWELPLDELLASAGDIPVAGAVFNGENALEADFPAFGLLVIGNEGRGISEKTESMLTHRLTIPRHPDGGAESLNASVAAGILAALSLRGR
ncbi:MAG: TrmH family RNA methyltransferase [Bacteroidota bacterium]